MSWLCQDDVAEGYRRLSGRRDIQAAIRPPATSSVPETTRTDAPDRIPAGTSSSPISEQVEAQP
ncbi:MAG: hypothetical protein AB9919_14760 [Geobacteraceae bacterium]